MTQEELAKQYLSTVNYIPKTMNQEQENTEEYHSVERTEQDMKYIDSVLKLPINSTQINLDTRYRFHTAKGRAISHLLLNKNKFGGDSQQMTNVKKSVENLEELLGRERDDVATIEYIEELQMAYKEAISFCQDYCDTKNPTFATGIARKNMVNATLQNLKDESKYLEAAKKLIAEGNATEQMRTGKDLLVYARVNAPQEEKKASKGKDINSITFEDFAQMIGTYNRGQVEFTSDGLKIINNGLFSMSKGEESAENIKVRQRLLTVAINKLGEKPDPAIMMNILHILGLDTGEGVEKPVSRKDIKSIVALVNESTSVVASYLKQGEKQEEYKKTNEYIIAQKTNSLVGVSSEAHIEANEKEEIQLKRQINDIFLKSKNAGYPFPELNKHQMDNLVRGNISRVRDEIFNSINRVYRGMAHINGGKATNVETLFDKKEMDVIVALTIYKMATVTEEGGKAAEIRLTNYIREASFKYAKEAKVNQTEGEEELQREDFYKLNVRMLSGGAQGLDELVERKLAKTKQWRNNKKKLNKGLNTYKDLCNKLKDIKELRNKAFEEGLNEEQADKLKELGRQVDNIIHGENSNLDDIAFVAKELKGTRFAAGYDSLEIIRSKQFSFAETTAKVADKMKTEGTHGETEEQRVEKTEYREYLGETEEVNNYVDHMEGELKSIANALTMKVSASKLINEMDDKSGKEMANLLNLIHKELHNFRVGEYRVSDFKFKDNNVRLVHRDTGFIDLHINDNKVSLPFTATLLADNLEIDMMSNEEIYGEEQITNIVNNLDISGRNMSDFARARNILTKFLAKRVNKESTYFNNVPIGLLKIYAMKLLRNQMDAEQVANRVNTIENSQKINSEEALELLEKMEEQKANMSEKVVMNTTASVQSTNTEWPEEEEKVKNLISDFVYSKHTWVADKTLDEPGKRLAKMVEENVDALIILARKPELLNSMLDKIPIAEEEGENNIKSVLADGIGKLVNNPAYEFLRNIEGEEVDEAVKETIFEGLKTDMVLNELINIDQQIDEAVENGMNSIQNMINECTRDVFGQGSDNTSDGEQIDTNISGDTSAELDRILKSVANGDAGQGLFIKNVFQNYFKNVSILDKRSMLAGAMRNAQPKKELGADASNAEKRAEEGRIAGLYIGGLLKGAGPLMQKMMQGMPTEGMPPEMIEAMKDVKSKLASIPEEIIKEQMWSIVERSKGNIEKIEVTRVLGAASVGQAFLCKIYGPNIPQEGQNVVVKLLRPDVRNRMEREKPIMLECARNTDAGMEATYLGQLQRIEEELDLTIEADNVEEGRIYDQHTKDVKAMKVSKLVAPTSNAMVLEEAKGETVDKYMDRIKKESIKQANKVNSGPPITDIENMGNISYMLNSGAIIPMINARGKLIEIIKQIEKRREHLTALCKMWVEEGVYGNGFYHGDLHAGNMIINDDELTVIDFGNATKLSRHQQDNITRVVAATAVGNIDLFMDGFRNLLENTTDEQYNAVERQLREEIDKIIKYGTQDDTGKRIAASLIKAQEIGIELPPAINNFSQSQLRLENTLKELDSIYDNIRNCIKEIDEKIPNIHIVLPEHQGDIFQAFYKSRRTETFSDLENINMPKYDVKQMLESESEDDEKQIEEKMKIYNEKIKKELNYKEGRLSTLRPSTSIDIVKGYIRDVYRILLNMPGIEGYEHKVAKLNELRGKEKKEITSDEINEVLAIISQTQDYNEKLNNKFNEFKNIKSNKGDNPERFNEMVGEVKEAYRELQYAVLNLDYKKPMTDNLDTLMYDKSNADKALASWFEDKSNYGEELKTLYDEMRAEENKSDKMRKFHDFYDVYRKAYEEKENMYNKIYKVDEKPIDGKLPSFMVYMSQIVTENLRASIDRLGFWNSIRYGLSNM